MFEQAFKNIDDVLRKEGGCTTTELDYAEQTSWLLFQKYLTAWSKTGRTKLRWPASGIKNMFLSKSDNASVSLRKRLLESCNV